jgi:uncharacterized protein YpmB
VSNKKYPFKHLSAYEREDKPFYFGREKETAELYRMTFETDLILLYGISGVGKSSLIGCGLASKFETYEWCEISVRRGGNFNDSLWAELKSRTKNNTADIAEQIKTLRNIEFRPVYLIFDQFEEIFISGEEAEQKEFYNTVKQILALKQPVKIIISIREEYLAHLSDFEKTVPQLFSHKCWVQPSKIDNFNIIDEILQGVNNANEESCVWIEDKEKLSEEIKQMFRNSGAKTVDLPSLQILFDEFYFALTNNDSSFKTKEVSFNYGKLKEVWSKNIKDIIFDNYLTRFVKDLNTQEKVTTNDTWGLLRSLVTESGTKAVRSEKELAEIFHSCPQITNFFKTNNILKKIARENDTFWELCHDSLAKCISEKMAADIALENLIETKRNAKDDYLTPYQLDEINKRIDSLLLNKKQNGFIKKSQLENRKKRLRDISGVALIVLLLCIVSWLWFTATEAKNKAEKAESEAIIAKDEAVRQKALAEEELNNRKMLEFYNLEKRAEIIKYAGGDPEEIQVQMLDIANTYPDSTSLKQSIERLNNK